ncbi:MAG: metallophosphoesterase family protein [Kiritimatiellia bacterium]
MTVAWIRSDDAPCLFTYGVEGKAAHELRVRPLRPIEGSRDFFYEVKLERLSPATRYVYSLRCPNGRHEAFFETFALHPDRFTFIYYGDNKDGREIHRKIVSRFAKHKPAFIMHSGDMTDHGRYEEYRPCFFEPLSGMIDHVPLFPCRGNHEGDGKAFRQVFSLPLGETWYSFDCGNTHFTVLDTTGWRHEEERDNIQRMYRWCEKDLAESRGTWKIAMYHEPSYDLGWRKDDWGRNDFLPLMRRHGTDLTLTGHAHGYQRLRPMVMRGENERHPITHVTSAGAGASVGKRPLDQSDFLAVEARRHNYVVITIQGERLEGKVFSEEDELLDRFEFLKHNGEYDRAVLEQALWEDDYGKPGKLKGPFSR